MSEMQFKYTKNGKKVAVVGKLNSEQWIVQEVFVSNGQEFPSGENFIETTLLDAPAETWSSKEVKRLDESKNKLELKIKELEKQSQILRRKSNAASLINKATAHYQNIDTEQLDTLFAFLEGRITHVVAEHYSDYTIIPLIDSLEDVDNWNGWSHFDGLKLVSLFGCYENGERRDKDRTFRLNWRINQYRDGSGYSTTVYPCSSYEEAIAKLDSLLEGKKACGKYIELKEKYELANPTRQAIAEYHQSKIDCINNQIKESQDRIDKLTKERDEITI